MANTIETFIPKGVKRVTIDGMIYSLQFLYKEKVICRIDMYRRFTIEYSSLTNEEIFKIGMFMGKSIENALVGV